MSYQKALEQLMEKYLPMDQIEVALAQIMEDIEGLPLSVYDLIWLLQEKLDELDLETSTSVVNFEGEDVLENIGEDERPFLILEILHDTWWVYVTRAPDCIWFYVTDMESVFEEVED